MKTNEYIIGKIRNADSFKLFLGRVSDINGSIVSGYHEKNAHLKKLRATFEIPMKDVVVNLGPKPHPGKVHGMDVSNLYTGVVKQHDFFGPIYFFYKPDQEVGQTLMKAFDRAASICKKLGFKPPEGTIWEVNSKDMPGKWAGLYAPSRDEKHPNIFRIKPEACPISVIEQSYVVLHEFAHHVHRKYMVGPKINARWIKLFNTSIKPATIKKEDITRLLEDLLAGEETPADFRRGLEEGDLNAFNWIVRTIGQDHAVGIKELNLLFEAEEHDEIRTLWPTRTLNKKELKPVVSEYATKNYFETVAEAFGLHYSGKQKLPAGVIALLEKSVQYAVKNQE